MRHNAVPVRRIGRDPAMTEEPADDRQAFAERQRPRGKAVAEVMNSYALQSDAHVDPPPRLLQIGDVGARHASGMAADCRFDKEDLDRVGCYAHGVALLQIVQGVGAGASV